MSGSDTSTHPVGVETAKARVLRVLGNGSLGIAFQPIVDLASGEIIGYEALTRLADTETFENTGALFAAAERAGVLDELERAARTRTFELSRELPPGCLLFVNNSPEVFCHADFSSSIEALLGRCPWLNPRRVVLEVTEQSAPASDSILDRHVLEMRERGYAVAIDDVGSGMNGLKRMMALRPNWLKLDIELIDDIENDPYKQSIIRFVVHFAKLCNMRIVAEGVERHEQLARLIELGVSHAQGFFIARPGSLQAPVREGLTATIRFLHEKAGMSRFHNPLTTTMRNLAEPATECPAGLAADDADRLLQESRNRPGLVLMEGPRFVGWLPASAVREAMLSAEQRRTPVLRLCRADNLLVDPDLALADALEIASNRPDAEMLHPLVVADGQNIVGVVTLRRLLSAAAASQGDAMRHVSPLTGMPNRVQADLWLGEHIER
ncbi:MAG: EAL domain-containing protein, partial [Phycisphaerales bacterium]|nr:EAL domain-containing protein [Phycisphaerales bacterium]